MNAAHFHLIVNHFPIIAPILGLLVLLASFYFRSEIMKRTAYSILIFGSILTIPAYFTGEGAEEVVERIQGIDETFIETHEETAKIFSILSFILGGVSILGIWSSVKQKSFSSVLAIIIVLLSLIVIFFAAKTATSGGEIRHTEIRQGTFT